MTVTRLMALAAVTMAAGCSSSPDYVGTFEGSYHGPLTGDAISSTLTVTDTSLYYSSVNDIMRRAETSCRANFKPMGGTNFLVHANCSFGGGDFRWTGSSWEAAVALANVSLERRPRSAN